VFSFQSVQVSVGIWNGIGFWDRYRLRIGIPDADAISLSSCPWCDADAALYMGIKLFCL